MVPRRDVQRAQDLPGGSGRHRRGKMAASAACGSRSRRVLPAAARLHVADAGAVARDAAHRARFTRRGACVLQTRTWGAAAGSSPAARARPLRIGLTTTAMTALGNEDSRDVPILDMVARAGLE